MSFSIFTLLLTVLRQLCHQLDIKRVLANGFVQVLSLPPQLTQASDVVNRWRRPQVLPPFLRRTADSCCQISRPAIGHQSPFQHSRIRDRDWRFQSGRKRPDSPISTQQQPDCITCPHPALVLTRTPCTCRIHPSRPNQRKANKTSASATTIEHIARRCTLSRPNRAMSLWCTQARPRTGPPCRCSPLLPSRALPLPHAAVQAASSSTIHDKFFDRARSHVSRCGHGSFR